MNVPNRFHNSGKPAKRTLKPQAVRSRKAALSALKRKLQYSDALTSILGRRVTEV